MKDKFQLVELNEEEIEYIEEQLEAYDRDYISYKLNGIISMGIKDGEKVIAGVYACMTDFKILYVSTLYVDKDYRHQGLGRRLMEEVELRAKSLGSNTIRLDTYNWQGRAFYRKLNYREVGSYNHEVDGFSEHFFVKHI